MQGLFRTFIISEIEGSRFGLYSFPICTTFTRGTNVNVAFQFIDPAFETSELVRH